MSTLDQNKTLYLFDPPYICKTKVYQMGYFNVDNYLELINIIKELQYFIFVSYESDFLKYIIKNEFKDNNEIILNNYWIN